MATNALMDSVLQQRQRRSKDENARTDEWKGKKSEEKAIAADGSPCLQQPYFITQHQRLGGNQAYLAILAPPPKQLLLPSFLLCFAMGKMNRSTYQLNAYTSD